LKNTYRSNKENRTGKRNEIQINVKEMKWKNAKEVSKELNIHFRTIKNRAFRLGFKREVLRGNLQKVK
jgi:hypothetical protein